MTPTEFFRENRKTKAKGIQVALGLLLTLASLKAEQGSPTSGSSPSASPFPSPVPIGFVFVVNSTGDADSTGGGAVCDDNGGNCTLRAAIQAANNASGTGNKIRFAIPLSDPGYNSATGQYTITIGSSLPDLATDVSVEGPGADKLLITAALPRNFRIFRVTTTGAASFSGMAIDHGLSSFSPFDDGGGIQNVDSAKLTITNCRFTNNSGAYGGGISSVGPVNIAASSFENNFAMLGGGAFKSGPGAVTVSGSTFTNNTSIAGLGDGLGGGILTSGDLTVTNCTFTRNAGRGGAAIVNLSGTVDVRNSTFSGNTAFAGGTITNYGTLILVNCTVTGNNRTSSGAPILTGAGGVYSSGTAIVQNTIIAGNSGSGSDVTPDVHGSFTSKGNNIIGKTDGSTGFTDPTDHTGTSAAPLDPGLDPMGLQNNGGTTQTVRVLAGSIAINNGNDAAAPARDQRGYIRSGLSDIGAFEFGGTIPVTLGNISTRAFVQTGDNVLIGGIIISGNGPKQVLLRALGPTLGQAPFNVPNALANPQLKLFDSTGSMILSNDDWGSASNAAAISATGKAPPNNSESAILTTLNPGAYTAIVSGVNNTTGVSLFDAFDQDLTSGSYFTNISTRAFVQTGDNVMIAGVIVQGPDSEKVILRGLGPTLGQPPFNVPNALQDPFLDLFDANGTRITQNDNWKDTQQSQIAATPYAPSNNGESAILTTLAPGNYTAILRGVNNTTGNALVEVYSLQ